MHYHGVPSAVLLLLCIFILHLILVCGSVLFSQVTNISNTNLIFQLWTVFRYPLNKYFSSGGSHKSITKRCSCLGCSRPVTPATAITHNKPTGFTLGRAEPRKLKEGNGECQEDTGKCEGSV